MQSLSMALNALQPPTQPPEPKSDMSLTLQRGLTVAAGKMTSAQLQHAATPYSQPLTPAVVSSVLSRLRSLRSCRTITQETRVEDPNYPKGTVYRQISYNLPTGANPGAYRALLIETIRPADKRLIMILLSQLMVEKPFFDADESQIRYRLEQLSGDLATYPYLAIWQAIDDIRTTSEKRGFPETAEIIRETKEWAEHLISYMDFFAHAEAA